MIRAFLALVCGFVAGGVANSAVVMLMVRIYPLPEGADMYDRETLSRFVESLPTPGFVLILIAHAGGALVGGFVAALITKRFPLALGAIMGGLFLVGGVINVIRIPSPVWFAAVDVLSYVPCGIAGAILALRVRSGGRTSDLTV